MSALPTLSTFELIAFSEVGSGAPDQAAKFLKSLAHPDQLKVLCVLLDGELPVAHIEASVGSSQSAISQHLARLKEEGIVAARREGRQILYSISDETVLEVLAALYKRFCA